MTRLCLLLSFFAMCAQSQAAILLSRPTDEDNPVGATSIAGQVTTADHFVPTNDWLVDSATFEGLWTVSNGAVGFNDTSRPFTIEFYQDENGSPADAPFQQLHVSAALSNPRLRGEGYIDYEIAATIPQAVPLASGTPYWFAVLDEGPGTGGVEGFFWAISQVGDRFIAQRPNQGAWRLFPDNADVAFTLRGSIVPEPSTIACAFVLFLICCVRRHAR